MNIVLIGYRGTGKSETSHLLAKRLNRPCISSDERIAQLAGEPITDYVARHGWDAFRDLEEQVVADMAAMDDAILDMGGGVVVRQSNIERLRDGGCIVWLRAAAETIRERIGGDQSRPSLTGTLSFVDEIDEVLRERTPLYTGAAELVLDTDGKSPATIAGEIVAYITATHQQI